jgi:hypothetical protein
MRTIILSWLLHQANRFSSSPGFYHIKDLILTKYGKQVGYDIQKIDGKKCWSCDGTGLHARYSNTPPYKPYDYDDCWHCIGGWYKLPKWICLARIKFGKYTFHKPLKREECVKNPFTEEEMGWKVTDQPVIKGYIEHTATWFGRYATLILYCLYDREMAPACWRDVVFHLKLDANWKWTKLKKRFTWKGITIHKPTPYIGHWFDAAGNPQSYDDDLPF